MGKCPASFQALKAAFETFSLEPYPLINSVILDSGSTIHICNNLTRFKSPPRMANPGDFVWAGDSTIPIEGYGDLDVKVKGPKGSRILTLTDVAFCPTFACSLVSLSHLLKRGIYWDTRNNSLRRFDDSLIGNLSREFDQFVIEYLPASFDRAAMTTYCRKINSWTARATNNADAVTWHRRLGHPGPRALEHLVNASEGTRIKGIPTVQCDGCGQGKTRRQHRRQAKPIWQWKPGERLAVDLHKFEPGRGRYKYLFLVMDRTTGYAWDYYLRDKTALDFLACLNHLFALLKRQYGIHPKVLESDNEITVPQIISDLLAREGIKAEPSASHTQCQNGGAERSGGVIKEKIRTMAIGANLPDQLWPEISKAATYLYNRTPKLLHSWKSPYERFHQFVANKEGLNVSHRRPNLTHLKVYGCKAFAMTPDAMEKRKRLKRLQPRAWIGYLVGYNSSNIYRIWNPATNQIVSIRDVVFDESQTYSGNQEEMKKDAIHVDLEDLAKWLAEKDRDHLDPFELEDEDEEAMEVDEDQLTQSNHPATAAPDAHVDQGVVEIPVDEEILDTIVVRGDACGDLPVYPTPPPTPPGAMITTLFAKCQEAVTSPNAPVQPWEAAFAAGPLSTVKGIADGSPVTTATLERLRRTPGKGGKETTDPVTREDVAALRQQPGGINTLHSSVLPPPPRWHNDLQHHPLGELFLEAEEDHLKSHEKMASWREIPRRQRGQNQQVLDCMWVYVYKLDDRGFLIKCKARLVVRGDQQAKGLTEENYAATLATRSLRTVLAIAARFDLELIQYDAVNAFVNAYLDDVVHMEMPPGHRKPNSILKLQKALYGLRRSPLLWQKELTGTLSSLGFEKIPHEPCVMIKNGIIVFFYVDDIVIAYKRDQQQEVGEFVEQLQCKYQLTGGDELMWFLGIEIHRDRLKGLIWLAQTSYIEKIARLAQSDELPATPMTKEELFPFDGAADLPTIRMYQRKIGSLLYAAVTTRPDIAFATSRLARFNQNPGPQHHKAADRVLRYLFATRYHALQLGNEDLLIIASDASFADNTLDRKSSQGYIVQLFGGLIAWRASKQDTVTTSTTEAELLALAQAGKEGFFVQRLLQELKVDLDDDTLQLQCDNTQTVRLVMAEIATLQTKLRHVDIHNHWLRQEAQEGRLRVTHVPTKRMIADGLTKALTVAQHQEFLTMLHLVPIQDLISARSPKQLTPEALQQLVGQEDLEGQGVGPHQGVETTD